MANAPADQDPIINLRGARVGLGPRDASMLEPMTRWINIFRTAHAIGKDPLPVMRAEEAWLARVPGPDEVAFVIYDLDDLALVGSIRLFHIDHRHHTCELGIAILDPDRRGRGLGTEAVRLITDYAIHGLEMHNVHLTTHEFNWAGRRAYEKGGFREYGRRREARLHNGRRWAIVFMEVLASEWESPVMQELMAPDERR